MWGLPSSGFRIWVHSDIVHLWSLRILRWLRGPFVWIHAISKKHTVSKHLSLSIGWLGFRPDTHRENYAEKQIFPWKWFCKLILSVSFVLLWGHFDTHTQREREGASPQYNFLDLPTSQMFLLLMAATQWTGTQLWEEDAAPYKLLWARAQRPLLRLTKWFISRYWTPSAKAGQTGQVLCKCWKLWFYVKKRQRSKSEPSFNDWNLPSKESNRWLFAATSSTPLLGCRCFLYSCPASQRGGAIATGFVK